MGLFDDILKKPVNQTPPIDPIGDSMGGQSSGQGYTQGGGQPPQDGSGAAPIFIEKSSEETIFGPDTESDSINEVNTPSPEPTVHAEEDTSSILIREPSPTIINSPISLPISQEVETPPLPTSTLISPQMISQEASVPSITLPEVVSTPLIQTPLQTPFETPMSSLSSPPPAMNIEQTPLPQENAGVPITTPNSSIFDSIMGVAPAAPVVAIQDAPAPVAPILTAPVVAEAPTITTSSSAHEFSTPREFIEKSITNIDLMLSNIDKRHAAKEAEEEGYRSEKLRFTELEKNAHHEKIVMDKEYDHGIHMRKILEMELQRDESNKSPEKSQTNHVESTLSEIGSEHPVHRHTHKKTESHAAEKVSHV